MPFTKKLHRLIFICGLLLLGSWTLFAWSGATSNVKANLIPAAGQELMASDGAFGDGFGYSVAISGDTAVISAYARQRRRGAAYVFVRSGAGWAEEATLTASDSEENDYFGLSVAISVAISGDTIVVPSAGGFLTLFRSTSAQPQVANSNFAAGEITNNVFTVALGAGDGAFKIFANATTHIIADVTGYYAPPATGGLYFHPLATPVRLLETRTGFTGCFAPGTPLTGTENPDADPNLDLTLQGRSPIPSPCNSIPVTAQVLVGNATSVFPSGGGYLTIYPSGGTRPTVASSNYAGGDVINGPFAVKLGADGKFKI